GNEAGRFVPRIDDQLVLEGQAGQLAGDIAGSHDATHGGVKGLGKATGTAECSCKGESSHANPTAKKIGAKASEMLAPGPAHPFARFYRLRIARANARSLASRAGD